MKFFVKFQSLQFCIFLFIEAIKIQCQTRLLRILELNGGSPGCIDKVSNPLLDKYRFYFSISLQTKPLRQLINSQHQFKLDYSQF